MPGVGDTVLYCPYISFDGTPEVWAATVVKVCPDDPTVLELAVLEPIMTKLDKWSDYNAGARLGTYQPLGRIAHYADKPLPGHWHRKG